MALKDLFGKKQKRKDLIAEIKEEFPKEGEQDLLDNEIKLLHKGLDEGNNIWVRDFLLKKSEFSKDELAITELAVIDGNEEELEKVTEAKARALVFHDRWINL